jgi:hypothetical protein
LQGSPSEARIAAARRLIDRRRYREALDILNDAIRFDPRKTDSFQLRALVFENLGLLPQAYADRQRAADLSRSGETAEPPVESPTYEDEVALAEDIAEPDQDPADPPTPDTVEEPSAEGAITDQAESPSAAPAPNHEPMDEPSPEEPARAPRVAPIPRYAPRPPREGGSGGAVARALGTTLIGVGLLAAFGVGIYIAFANISDVLDGGDDNGSVAGASPTPSSSAGASPTPSPGTPDDALSGSPLDFESLKAGWKSKSLTATPGDVSEDITGFAPTPVTVTLSRGGEEMEVAVLLYESAQGISQDWDLGERPTPKAGREIPSGATVWYNLNAVVVVIDSNEILRPDARDGFLSVNA